MGRVRGKATINVNDIVGKRLGKLKVLAYSHSKYDSTSGGERMRHYYICECDCGRIWPVRRSQLKTNSTYSCGCIKRKRR